MSKESFAEIKRLREVAENNGFMFGDLAAVEAVANRIQELEAQLAIKDAFFSDCQPHDAHVQAAHKVFRDCGFSIAAMQYKRTPEALAALRAFNKVPDGWQHPFAWNYHPNEWCARKWVETRKLR